MKKLSLIFLGFFLTASAVSAQVDFDKVQIETIKVVDNIYMLKGAGGNIGVSIGSDGILLIDTQYAQLYDKIKTALKEIGGGKIKFIINTHWHGDHTSGNANFSKEAPIIAHKNVRERMLKGVKTRSGSVEPFPIDALPVITYENVLTINMNGEEIKLVHFPPGHTSGDTVIYFTKSNVVHTGDLFFNGMFPYIDFDNGGNVLGYAKNVDAILQTLPDNVKIIPGHGPLGSKKDLQAFYDMLVETTAFIKSKIDAGLSVDEIKKAGLPEKWNSWGEGYLKPEVWIDFICRSYGYQK